MSNGEDNIFRHSSEKLSVLKGLIDSERYNLVKNYLKSLENDINSSQYSSKPSSPESLKANWITESYINYLSRYSNNLIQFSESRHIDIKFTKVSFNSIFEKYIYSINEPSEPSVSESISNKVRNKLYPKIENRVNIDFSLNSSHFENLFAPIEVNFIGANGIPVAGQAIDFEKRHRFLENDITRFVSLTKAIELNKDSDKGKYFVLGKEPDMQSDKNHLLWQQIRDSNFLEFIDIDETGIIEEYIEENNVRPYF